MSPSSIICEYIYGSFLLVEAALEVAAQLAQTSLDMLNTAVDAIISLFRFTMDLAIDTVVNGVRVIQKKLVDLIWDGYKAGKKSGFCNNLYKCNIFIEELTDRNSLICKTLIKLGVITAAQQQFINQIISDYDSFYATVCNFGFTFTFGLGAIRKLLNMYKDMIDGFIKTVERKKEGIRRMIQKYINLCIDTGIFDLMIKLRKFFNCILDQSDACSNIQTAHNFYVDMLDKLHLEEAGGNGNGTNGMPTGNAGMCGYRLASSDNNRIKNVFDSRLNRLNNVKVEMKKFADSMVSPSDVRTASSAFDLAKNIFPGGMSYKDIKEGNWHKNKMVRYFEVRRDQFIEAFYGKHQSQLPADVSTEFIINGMKVNDKDGKITIKVTDSVEEVIDMNDTATMQYYGSSINVVTPAEPIEYYSSDEAGEVDSALEFNGTIMSGNRAAVRIAVENDTALEDHCKAAFINVTEFIKDSEMVKKW